MARPGEDPPPRVSHIADGVDDDQSTDDDIATSGARDRGAQAGGHHLVETRRFAAGRAGTSADPAFSHILIRLLACAIRVVGPRPADRFAGVAEVEDDSGRDDRDGDRSYRKTAAPLAQPAHRAIRRAETMR